MYPLLGCPKLVPIRVPSWCQSGLRFGPTAGSLFLLRFGCWSRQQAMACHGRVFNLRFDCVLNRFVYPSRSKLAFWSCVLNSVICVPEPCVSVLRAKPTKIYTNVLVRVRSVRGCIRAMDGISSKRLKKAQKGLKRRPKMLFEPARCRQCARRGCSSLLWCRLCVRKGCSSLLFKITV